MKKIKIIAISLLGLLLLVPFSSTNFPSYEITPLEGLKQAQVLGIIQQLYYSKKRK